MYSLTQCPVCGNKHFIDLFPCKDHTVSKKEFQLAECMDCKLVFTNPRPDSDDLDAYYLSEEYISHTSKSTSPLDLIYKLARVFTLDWKYSIVKANTAKGLPLKILDYGCGTGDFLKRCLQKGNKVEGVEPS